jgi:RimJ/RimL family protein N-acetyltransferase
MIERLRDGYALGCVTICDIGQAAPGWAEWGRWVMRPRAAGAMESAWLVYRAAFTALNLEMMYSRTVAANAAVVSFHDGCGLERHALLKGYVTLNGQLHDSVEHRLSRADWPAVDQKLGTMARRRAQSSR